MSCLLELRSGALTTEVRTYCRLNYFACTIFFTKIEYFTSVLRNHYVLSVSFVSFPSQQGDKPLVAHLINLFCFKNVENGNTRDYILARGQ